MYTATTNHLIILNGAITRTYTIHADGDPIAECKIRNSEIIEYRFRGNDEQGKAFAAEAEKRFPDHPEDFVQLAKEICINGI